MSRALAGSIVVHAIVAAIGIAIGATDAPRSASTASAISVSMIDVPRIETPPVPSTAAPSLEVAAGGGSSRGGASARRSGPRPARGRTAATVFVDPRGEIRIEASAAGTGDHGLGSGNGNGRGNGSGLGVGIGNGNGYGDGHGFVVPAAPAASKARPPILIYPKKRSTSDDEALFVARLVIDDDGFVSGARLVRGFGGKRDETAGSLVWRFRYLPALDHDGRPIEATIEQSFLVGD